VNVAFVVSLKCLRVVHAYAFVHTLMDVDTCFFSIQVANVVHVGAFVHMLRDCDVCSFV
jgi:hypothetical protein